MAEKGNVSLNPETRGSGLWGSQELRGVLGVGGCMLSFLLRVLFFNIVSHLLQMCFSVSLLFLG